MKSQETETEVVIIGAGPCGLFQVFELGLLGIRAHVIDSLRRPGGQCMELYPDKPIYDIPALPVCSARELIDRLLEQAKPFKPTLLLGREVNALERLEDGRFRLGTSRNESLLARAVIIAAGVGAFQPRRLKLPGAETHEQHNLAYRVREPERYHGKHLVILGGGDSALDWTLNLAEKSASLTLIHRRSEFRAAPASVAKMRELEQAGRLRCLVGRVRGLEENSEGRLHALLLHDLETDSEQRVTLEELLIFYGLAPKLGPIAAWGADLAKNQLIVDPERFQTSIPGLFAIGDINTYPGKKKLILSGFHEAALAAFAVDKLLHPERKQFLQYTTTSPILHQRLGVEPKRPAQGESAG